MKDKLGFILLGCMFIFGGLAVIDTGLLGGGPQTPLVHIGANKYWVGGVLVCFGLWVVISMLFKSKSK